MSMNPYASPPPDSTPTDPQPPLIRPPGLRDELRAIATNQRNVLWCILAQLVVYFALTPLVRSGQVPPLVFQAALGVMGLIGMVLAILLGMRVYGVVLGILCGVLVVIPCLGFLLLVLMNQRATAYLQQHGVTVGFMGADPESIQ